MLPKLIDFVFRRVRPVPPEAAPTFPDKLLSHPNMWWLTDVPMFIDEQAVDRLYGAIVQPEYILLQSSETSEATRSQTKSEELETSAGVSVPAFLKLGTKGKLAGSAGTTTTQSAQITKQFVYSSEQRLQDLVVSYAESAPNRVLFEKPDAGTLTTLSGATLDWAEAEALLDTPGPRPLIFIDLAPGVRILPMAGETTEGKTVLLYKPLIERLTASGHQIPSFPADSEGPGLAAKKKAHWDALLDAYDNRVALEVIEEAFSEGQRIEWIDYRLKLPSRDKPVHLHFTPGGRFPTGAFAFNMVRRGFKVGLRMVGQLKKGCDINALAIYER